MNAADLILNVPTGIRRGYAAEMVAAVYLMGQDWNVAFAAAGCAFDLVAEKNGVTKTIQVKLAWNKDSSNPLVSLVSKSGHGAYKAGAFDVYAFVIPNHEDGTVDVCFWPLDGTDGRVNRRVDDELRANNNL